MGGIEVILLDSINSEHIYLEYISLKEHSLYIMIYFNVPCICKEDKECLLFQAKQVTCIITDIILYDKTKDVILEGN